MQRGADHVYSAAVVGGGKGGRLSMDALAASPRFELVAAADLRLDVQKQLTERYPGMRTFTTHKEMFTECPVEVVCVSTYPPTHEEVTVAALSIRDLRGALVEKPLGHTAASGRNIVDMLRARNLPLAVPHGLLARRTPTEVIERVSHGDIGNLKLVEIQNKKWDIVNAGIHWLNFFVSLTANEPITHVLAQADKTTRTFRDGMQVETIAVTSVQNRTGARVVMHTGDDVVVNVDGKETVFRIFGTRGMIEFYGWEDGYLIDDHWIVPAEFPTTGHRRHLDNLADQMDGVAPDYSIAESSLAALEICDAAYLSAKHGCRIAFPLQEFVVPNRNDWEPGKPYTGFGGGRDGRNL